MILMKKATKSTMLYQKVRRLELKGLCILFLLIPLLLPSCGYARVEQPYTETDSQPDSMQQKDVIELKIATIRHPQDHWGMDNDIQLAAASFNQDNPDCHIIVVDYSEDGKINVDNALRRINTEIISGNYPDMICFSQISPYPFISKDLLLNMDDCIASDPTVSPNDIVSIQALRSFGGLFLLGSNITVDTLVARYSQFGSRYGWTLQEYLNLEASCSPDTWMIYNITHEEFLKKTAQRYTRTAIDWSEGICDFYNENFIEILLASSRIQDRQANESNALSGFTGALVSQGKLIAAVAQTDQVYSFALNELDAGEELSYIGWPTVDGSCGTDIRFQHPVGIVSKSKHVEECWRFVKYLLQEHNIKYGIPVYMPRLLTEINDAQSSEEKNTQMTRRQAERLLDLLVHVENTALYDDEVIEIIMSESTDFFAGYKTAEETAEAIQSKVSLYVAEQK